MERNELSGVLYTPQYFKISHLYINTVVIYKEGSTLMAYLYNVQDKKYMLFQLFLTLELLTELLANNVFPDFVLNNGIEFLSTMESIENPYIEIDIKSVMNINYLVDNVIFTVYQTCEEFSNKQWIPYSKGLFTVDAVEYV